MINFINYLFSLFETKPFKVFRVLLFIIIYLDEISQATLIFKSNKSSAKVKSKAALRLIFITFPVVSIFLLRYFKNKKTKKFLCIAADMSSALYLFAGGHFGVGHLLAEYRNYRNY